MTEAKRPCEGKEKRPKKIKLVPYRSAWFRENVSVLRQEIAEKTATTRGLLTTLATRSKVGRETISQFLQDNRKTKEDKIADLAKAWSKLRREPAQAKLNAPPDSPAAVKRAAPTIRKKSPPQPIPKAPEPSPKVVPKAPKEALRPLVFAPPPKTPSEKKLEDKVQRLKKKLKEARKQVYLKYPIALDDWRLLNAPAKPAAIDELLGEGAFGQVSEVLVQVKYAVKWFKQVKNSEDKWFEREITQLVKCQHQYIVRMIGWGTEPRPYVVMELMDTNLNRWMVSTKPLGLSNYTESDLQHLLNIPLFQIAIVCLPLSSHTHRPWITSTLTTRCTEISSQPMSSVTLPARFAVFSNQEKIKLCDFGLSNNLEDAETFGPLGSPLYMPPEHNRDTTACDVYAFGTTAFHLLFGAQFLNTFNQSPYLVQVYNNQQMLPLSSLGHPNWKNMKALHALIMSCWKWQPSARPTFRTLLTTYWKAHF